MTRIRLQYILSFLVATLLLGGCMKEDYSDCGLYLKFRYTNHPEQTDWFAEKIETVDLFIFNEEGIFQEQWNHSASQGNELHLNLEKGAYTVVAWGNLSDDFKYTSLQPGVTTFDKAILSLKRDEQNTVTIHPQPLYHAIARNLEIKKIGIQRSILDFSHNINHIEVNVEGLPINEARTPNRTATAPGTQFTILVTGNNGDYKFDNSHWEKASQLQYTPVYKQTGKNLTANFTLMRLSQNDGTRLIVQHTESNGTKRTIYDEELSILLHSNPQIDLDIYSEFQVNLKFDDLTYALISITVNGWESTVNDDGQGGVIG